MLAAGYAFQNDACRNTYRLYWISQLQLLNYNRVPPIVALHRGTTQTVLSSLQHHQCSSDAGSVEPRWLASLRLLDPDAQRAKYLPKRILCIGAHAAFMTRLCRFRRTSFRGRRHSEEFLQRKPIAPVPPEGDHDPAMRRPHAAWKTQSRQRAVSARTEVLLDDAFRDRSLFRRCPSEPKLFQAVSSRTEVPSDGALPNRSSFRRCLPEPKFLPTVPFRTEALSDGVR